MAPRRPAVLETHGDRREDDWLWLRDRDDPEVLDLLRAENAYTAAATAHLAGFHEDLFDEIRSRIVETDLSVPVRKDGWWYYTRTVEGQDYAIHCRLPVDGEGRDPGTPPGTTAADPGSDVGTWPDEQVLLDENSLAGDGAYLDVANLSVSPGHTRLAYAVDTTGDERFTLRVRDLASGQDLAESVEGTSYGVAWANDDETLFYTRPDAANRTYQLWRHRLGAGGRRRRPRLRGARRAFPPGGRSDQGRRLRPPGAAFQDHQRGPRHRRRPAGVGLPGGRAPASGNRVRGRAPRRDLPPPHQRRGREFPAGGHAGGRSRSGPLDRGHRPP